MSEASDDETKHAGDSSSIPVAANADLLPRSSPPAPSTLVDPFVHYADRSAQLALRTNARLVSNSEVQTFKRCRRKWWLAWFRGLRPKTQQTTGPMAIGDRVHRALSYWYRPVGTQRMNPLDALEALILSDIDQFKETERYAAADPSAQIEMEKAWQKDADLERAMIEGYMEWVAETGADSHLEVIESEQYLDAQLPISDPDLPVYIIAKMDVRAFRTTDNVRLFIDHKTVASFAQKTMTMHMDEQMLMYHLIEWINQVENRCDGAIYNMLRRVKRTVKATPPFYQRVEIRHNLHELAAFRYRLIGTITDMLNVEQALKLESDRKSAHFEWAYPRPTADCHWDCPFFTVCPMFDNGSRAEDMIKQYFVQGDPLSYYVVDREELKRE